MRGRRSPSVATNPVFVGAVTVLVIVAAVLLAYQANRGLPFVPAFEIKVETPDAARLVVGNEVREGGFRIGQVAAIEPVGDDPETAATENQAAELTLKLDKAAAPIPDDSTIRIRPRSALGLKYVDFVRGKSGQALPEGAVITTDAGAAGPELDTFFSIFDEETRLNIERNLDYFGQGLAGRGASLNRTLGALPELLGDLPPVMRTLSNPDTRLQRLLAETGDVTRIIAPLSNDFARGFTGMADTFDALSRDPQALRDTIDATPATLDTGIATLPEIRPLLRSLAEISDEVQGTASALRVSLPAINSALEAGIPVLKRTPEFTEKLEGSLRALEDLAQSPTTDITLAGVTDTMGTLNPTLQWLGPHVTVCNYFTYWWTHLADHISDEDATGTVQRIQVKQSPLTDHNAFGLIGAPEPVSAGPADPVQGALFGDPANFHGQVYGAAVDANGDADCESGQRGYLERLAAGYPEDMKIVADSRTPGLQGPTYKGRARVPEGQSFSSEPTGIAPPVVGQP